MLKMVRKKVCLVVGNFLEKTLTYQSGLLTLKLKQLKNTNGKIYLNANSCYKNEPNFLDFLPLL